MLPDPDGTLHRDLDAASRSAAERPRTGLGADGVIRVLRARPRPAGRRADWFMDYRNADGSVAEMCGNGVRVFARYLWDTGLGHGAGRCRSDTRGGVSLVR